LAIGGVSSPLDSLVVAESSVLRTIFCAEKPAHRKSANRHAGIVKQHRKQKENMNISILIANILTLLAFIAHTFIGDKELKVNEPTNETDENYQKREKWTMARCGWHWVSFDLLFATIGLGLINFTDHFDNEKTLLQILSIYFLGYAVVWALTISISKQFPKSYLNLGQWILLLLISGLIYFGTN
jgi:hypothetical protein